MQQKAANERDAGALTPAQERAIESLLVGETKTDAAAIVGVDRSTIHRWLQQPAFIAAFNSRRNELCDAHDSKLQRLQTAALAVVAESLDTGNASVALAILKGTGLLGGSQAAIGPADVDGVEREHKMKERDLELQDMIYSLGG